MDNLTFSFFQILHKSSFLALLDYIVLDCLQANTESQLVINEVHISIVMSNKHMLQTHIFMKIC